MNTQQTRLAAQHQLEDALTYLANNEPHCIERALEKAEHAAQSLDKIAQEPRPTFERQASHYVSLWLTNDEASYNAWRNVSAQDAKEALTEYAQDAADVMTAGHRPGTQTHAIAHALAELLTRAVAWLDYDAIAAQLQED